MRKQIFITIYLLIQSIIVFGQKTYEDSINVVDLKEVEIVANRIPVLLKSNPGAVSLVTNNMLAFLPKSIAADEALRLVPGVRIDNQHGGERIHMSIRGQGILTERGLRGIGVIIDGIPVNDPSGFAPDLYDVDWSSINRIEVMRGPSAGLYGGAGSGGVLNIITKNGGGKPIGGEFSQSLGSNGFYKSFLQVDGSKESVDYRVSYSRLGGNGYRDHQGFWGNKLYEKINFQPSEKVKITQIFSHTDYFHQNPEGLNKSQFDNLMQANPDACPFNEYQKTNRSTIGLNVHYLINKTHEIVANSYLRSWDYKETSNRCAEYRNITNSGTGLQYNLHLNSEKIKNTISLGTDFKYQNIGIYKLQSASNPDRVESLDQTNIETDSLMANQIISQDNIGMFGLYKMQLKKLTLFANFRYDIMDNKLTNKMMEGDTAITEKNFSQSSIRIGASYNFSDAITFFVNWSQGFIPPSTEELASNPLGYSGFNTYLVPATSNCIDIGTRGFVNKKIYYELTVFDMNTENDFFRFKQSGRGNQEVFYGNAGNSKRLGLETYFSYKILDNLSLGIAYTFSDYKYTSANVNPVFTDTSFVLTTPPSDGQYLPNSPKHQLYGELVYSINKRLKISFGTELQTKWAIYTDAKAYEGELDSEIYQNWQEGFNLYHARVSYDWNIGNLEGQLSIYGRNLTDQKYMAFTEPDPDGNSYQPGPGRELFFNLKVRF